MRFSAHEEARLTSHYHCKYLTAFIRDACVRCHCSCIGGGHSLISSEEESSGSNDLDFKHVIILEIRSRAMRRAMRAQFAPSDYSFPTWETVFIAPEEERKNNGEEDGSNDCNSDYGDDAFFSVRSCFTHYSSESGLVFVDSPKSQSILEEFCHCEGWPFGLGRKALMLPPLPSSPSDSWTWRKRNLVNKPCKVEQDT